jgi:hypothetical protein
MDGGTLMLLIFIFLVATMLTARWYTTKYKTKINLAQIMLIVFGLVAGGFYLLIKNLSSNEKETIIQNVSLKNTVTAITFDPHKPYFKSMTLDDGQYLPMPEAMNAVLQVGDSIYKNSAESFYTVVNAKTKIRINYAVHVHERVLSKSE